jgi:CBS domain-containing protein
VPPRAVSSPGRAGDRVAAERTPVSAVMTTEVWAVQQEVGLEVLTDLLLARGLDGVPVVDADGHPSGIVSQTDLVRERFFTGDTGEAMGPGRHASRGHYRVEIGPGVHAEALPRTSVADAMTCAAFSVSERASVAQAVMLMASKGVHRVPVVSDDGRVAGMITSLDVLRWLARQGGHPVPEA